MIRYQYINTLEEFLENLPVNGYDEPLWEINKEEGEITPISYSTENPEIYIKGYIDIVKWLKKRHLNCESGYSFIYENQEDPDDRSVGGINSNNEGVTFIKVNGYGKISHQFYKI